MYYYNQDRWLFRLQLPFTGNLPLPFSQPTTVLSWVRFVWWDSNLTTDDGNRSGLSPKVSPSLSQNWKKGVLVVFYWSLELKEGSVGLLYSAMARQDLWYWLTQQSQKLQLSSSLLRFYRTCSFKQPPLPQAYKAKAQESLWEWPLPKFLTSSTGDGSTSQKWPALVIQTHGVALNDNGQR